MTKSKLAKEKEFNIGDIVFIGLLRNGVDTCYQITDKYFNRDFNRHSYCIKCLDQDSEPIEITYLPLYLASRIQVLLYG